VVAAAVAAIVVAAATATVTAVAAMATETAGVAALVAKATALSSAIPMQHFVGNMTISLKRDAQQRCHQQMQGTGNNQPMQQKNKRAGQHECQCNDSNGDNNNCNSDGGNNNNNEDNYVSSDGQH
jgi:hypothetical protein